MNRRWSGFYIQDGEQYPMEFGNFNAQLQPSGLIAGEGVDTVGRFRIEGCFHPEFALCRFVKEYFGQHKVYYQGVYRQEMRTIEGHYGFQPGDNNGTFRLFHSN